MFPRSVLILTFCILVSSPAHSAKNEVLTINVTGQPPLNNEAKTGFMDLVATEAFKRIGITLKTVRLPAERGLKNANMGIEDGEMSRIAGLDKVYSNLVRVPEKIMDWEFVVFSNKSIDLSAGWQGLSSNVVSFINGWKIIENNVPKKATISKVKNARQLFALLKRGRTDLVIYERWGGLLFIKEFNLSDIKQINPPLAVKDMYIYLHKKHKALVPKLANALKSMKRDNSYQKIFDEILLPLK